MNQTARKLGWRNFQRGVGWLVIAAVGLWSMDHLAWTGLSEYSIRKLGALFAIAGSVFGSYRISRDVLRIDPSSTNDPIASALLSLARAIVVTGIAVAVCVSV